MADSVLAAPEPLALTHQIEDFDCGVASLDGYILKRALDDQRAGKSRTYVTTTDGRVVGYFSLAAGSVAPPPSSRLPKGQGRQPVPVVLLARLAVDRRWQGRGVGAALLTDALTRATAAADVIGARAVLVHAIDPRARSFYTRHGFEPLPTDDLHLVMLMKDIRKTLGL